MQKKSQILYSTTAKLIHDLREEKGITYLNYCYENDIATTTYDNFMNGKTETSFYNIAKIINGVGLSFGQFGDLLDKNLPDDFWDIEE